MKKTLLFISVLVLSISTLFAQKPDDYMADAEKGDAGAQYNLGVCYNNGYGVIQDYNKAKYWFKKAAAQGDEDAKELLKQLE